MAITKIQNVTDIANDLLKIGICAVPTKMPDKRPDLPEWTKFQTVLPIIGQHRFNGAVGIITGKISGNIFVLDIDIKYDFSGTLLERLQNEIGPELWDRIFQVAYIQRTINNGLHIFLRCEEIEGNQKLAQRPATAEELKTDPNKTKTLLETRAEGGFIVCAPTEGYTQRSGSLLEIGSISIDDKERLFECCRSLNEVFEEIKPPLSKKFISELSDLPPWEDYNRKADVPALLQSHQWSYIKTVGENQHYCRPGKKGATSGTWNEKLNLFRVFSTATQLQGDKSYSPAALFAFLECGSDFSEAGKRLLKMGYGEHAQKTTQKAKGVNPMQSIQDIWKDILITEEPPEETSLIEIGGVSVATSENHSLVVGKKKSRKTLFLVWLLGQYSGDISTDILFFDTEQGKRHVYQIRKKLFQLTGKWVPVFYLRGKSPQERQQIIFETVRQWPTRPKLILIDGIRDLLSNINDPDQSTDLIVWLENITVTFSLHVMNVLHLNKTDSNARGHIGTELQNKAEMTIEVEKDEQGGYSLVKCESSRDQPFETFAFTHSTDGLGLPEIISMPIKGEILSDTEQKERLTFVFENGLLQYSELIDQVKAHFDIAERKAKTLVAGFNRKGWIVSNKTAEKRYPVYKLLI